MMRELQAEPGRQHHQQRNNRRLWWHDWSGWSRGAGTGGTGGTIGPGGAGGANTGVLVCWWCCWHDWFRRNIWADAGGRTSASDAGTRDAGAPDAQLAGVVIDTRKPACTDQVLLGHSAAVGGVAFSPDGHFLASAGNDHMAKIWRVSDGTLVVTLSGSSSPLTSVAYTPDGQTLVTGGAALPTTTVSSRSGSPTGRCYVP